MTIPEFLPQSFCFGVGSFEESTGVSTKVYRTLPSPTTPVDDKGYHSLETSSPHLFLTERVQVPKEDRGVRGGCPFPGGVGFRPHRLGLPHLPPVSLRQVWES